eukprot:SM000287S10622  [mRNA]  locus=s287:46550:70089:+ [translate_table: standard]
MSAADAVPRPRSASRAAVDDKVSLSGRRDFVSLSVANSGPVRRQGLRFSAWPQVAELEPLPETSHRHLPRHFFAIASSYFIGDQRWKARSLMAVMLALTVGKTGIRVLMSYAQRDFTTAMAKRDKDAFYFSIAKYLILVLVASPLFALYDYMKGVLVLEWRVWQTESILAQYFANRAYFEVKMNGKIDNPDQRICEDTSNFVQTTVSILMILADKVLSLAAFAGVLWSISPTLVYFIMSYSVLGTIVTRFQREADLRYSLVRVRDSAESIAFYRGEPRELACVTCFLRLLVENTWERLLWHRHLGLFINLYDHVTIVVPSLIIAQQYFAGEVEFGVVTQTAYAFTTILHALMVFVTKFEDLSGLAAKTERLDGLLRSLGFKSEAFCSGDATVSVQGKGDNAQHLKKEPPDKSETELSKTGGWVGDSEPLLHSVIPSKLMKGVSLATPDRRHVLFEQLTFSLDKGEALLIMGPSGCGKSSLLRAIAGLWRAGEGVITLPPAEEVFFLPQKPYMPQGSLRTQLLFPKESVKGKEVDDLELLNVLVDVALEALPDRVGGLDAKCNWSDMLSSGEQQRIAFARRPAIAFLDEATSALDSANEAKLYNLLRQHVGSYVSVGHRPSLLQFHTQHRSGGSAAAACARRCRRRRGGPEASSLWHHWRVDSVLRSGPGTCPPLRPAPLGVAADGRARGAAECKPAAPAALLRHRERLICRRPAVEGARTWGRHTRPPSIKVLMSYTSRDFTTAMTQRDKDAFYFSVGKYLVIVLVATPLFALYDYMKSRWKKSETAVLSMKICTASIAAGRFGPAVEGVADGFYLGAIFWRNAKASPTAATPCLPSSMLNARISIQQTCTSSYKLVEDLTIFCHSLFGEANRAYFEVKINGKIDNPDQRSCEDTSNFVRTIVSLFMILADKVLSLTAFGGVLWSISPNLVYFIMAYSGLGTFMTIQLFGLKLMSLYKAKACQSVLPSLLSILTQGLTLLSQRFQCEADLRYSIVRVRDSAESIAFYRGEPREMACVNRFLSLLVKITWERLLWHRHLGLFISLYDHATIVVPSLMIARQYFAGEVILPPKHSKQRAIDRLFSSLEMAGMSFSPRWNNLSGPARWHDRLWQWRCDSLSPRKSTVPTKEEPSDTSKLELSERGGLVEDSEPLLHSAIRVTEVSVVLSCLAQVPKTYLALGTNNNTLALLKAEEHADFDRHSSSCIVEVGKILHKQADTLSLQGVSLATPDRGHILFEQLTFSLNKGKALLIMGPSGCSKSSLLRATAGLWHAGEGVITLPPVEDVFFLPQKPYMPQRSLRTQVSGKPPPPQPQSCHVAIQCPSCLSINVKAVLASPNDFLPCLSITMSTHMYCGLLPQLLFPKEGKEVNDKELLNLLVDVALGTLPSRVGVLDAKCNWSDMLSSDEQQRIAFARRPAFAFLDEATSAVDSANEAKLYSLLRQHVSSYVSVGHRPSLLQFHTQVTLAAASAAAAPSASGAGDGDGRVPAAEAPPPPVSKRRLLRRFFAIAGAFFRGSARWKARGLMAVMLALSAGSTGIMVVLSYTQRDFSTAMAAKDRETFYVAILKFLGIVAVAAPLFAMYDYMQGVLILEWRVWLTKRLMEQYFANRAYFAVKMDGTLDNPDQRICEDAASFASTTVSIITIIVNKVLNLGAFAGVLWSISPQLVYFILVYSAVGTLITVRLFGLKLMALQFECVTMPSRLHFTAAKVGSWHLSSFLKRLVENTWKRLLWSRYLSLFGNVYDYATIVIPSLIIAPRYFKGEVEFGVVTQTGFAFRTILHALTVIVSRFEDLSGLAAKVERLDGLLKSLDYHSGNASNLNASTPIAGKVESRAKLRRRLSEKKANGVELAETPASRAADSEPLLQSVVSMRAPDAHNPLVCFLLMPSMQLLFPGEAEKLKNLDEAHLLTVMADVALEWLPGRVGGLDTECSWADVLSTGEQQRIALARVILHRPAIAFLDEATSALDGANEARLYTLLKQHVGSFVSVGHRTSLLQYHTQVLHFTEGAGWTFQRPHELQEAQRAPRKPEWELGVETIEGEDLVPIFTCTCICSSALASSVG